jgi:hypothetical protein
MWMVKEFVGGWEASTHNYQNHIFNTAGTRGQESPRSMFIIQRTISVQRSKDVAQEKNSFLMAQHPV